MTYADLNTQKNSISLDIDGSFQLLTFVKGGTLKDGNSFEASFNGGQVIKNCFAPTLCDGHVLVSYDLAKFLIEASKNLHYAGSSANNVIAKAIHSSYISKDGGFTIKRVFNGVRFNMASLPIENFGEDVDLFISFSLNDEDIANRNVEKSDTSQSTEDVI